MSRMFIADRNAWDDCELTASSEIGSLPAVNTQVNPVGRPYRGSGSSVYIDFDHGSSTVWRVFALLGSNLTPTATIRLRLSDTAPSTGDVYDSSTVSAGMVDGYGWTIHEISEDKTARYGRLDVSDAALNNIDIGRIFAGPHWQPSFNRSYGGGIRWVDFTTGQRTPGGQLIINPGAKILTARFVLEFLPEAEMMANAFEIDRRAGRSKDILVALDPDNYPVKKTIFGPMSDLGGFNETAFERMSRSYEIEQRL